MFCVKFFSLCSSSHRYIVMVISINNYANHYCVIFCCLFLFYFSILFLSASLYCAYMCQYVHAIVSISVLSYVRVRAEVELYPLISLAGISF